MLPMATPTTPLKFDAQLMLEDMAVQGLTKRALGYKSGCSDMTVIRFLRGEHQTAQAAYKLAKALGYSTRRYLISSRRQRVA